MGETLRFSKVEIVPGDTAQLNGTLLSITYRNEDNGYTVARLDVEGLEEPVTLVGIMPGVADGDLLSVSGQWTQHRVYGTQVAVERCEVRPPTGREGLIRFLASGRVKGVGPKTAEAIVDALGLDVLETVPGNPSLLEDVKGIGREKARSIAAQLEEHRAASSALVFLQQHGLGPGHAVRVWKEYGPATVEKVRENPWRLADEVFRIGFRTADLLALQLGHEPDSSARITAGLTYMLGRASMEGHVGLPAEDVVSKGAPFLEVDQQRVEAVLAECLEAGNLVEDGLVYRPELLADEVAVAEGIARLCRAGRQPVDLAPESAVAWAERTNRVELGDDQRRAIAVALESPVSVLTGGPGVGKTTLVRCLVDIFTSQGCRVALAAPTGRAARRLAAATGSEASTLHRLLGLTPARRHGRPSRLDLDVLIVDEMSMVDISLMAVVVQAVPPGACLVMVGDADQLPSVGPGEVLRDLIDAETIPVARLSTIFRQDASSGIVRVAHQLNTGEVPVFDEGATGQAFFIERADAAAALDTLKTLVTERIPRRFDLDPLRDLQVLTPVHSGPVGTAALNDSLRAWLNPPSEDKIELTRFGRLYREGDKVMQVRNDYDLGVSNGDIGSLRKIDEEDDRVIVRFDDRDVDYGFDDLEQLEPAFAITCHKSQGSEFPAVVLPLFTSHFIMLRRNLVYTAFTRAKQVLVAIGEPRALQIAVSTPGSGMRHSRLAERLRRE